MQIVFDPDFDQGAWPGPLKSKQAVFGEAWLGPIGLLDLLENQLGLTGKYQSNAERALGLVKPMQSLEGFWSRSADFDCLGTAKRLLQWRDALFLCGWRGQGRSQRLSKLARLTRDVQPGIPDRYQSLIQVLSERTPDVKSVQLIGGERYLDPAGKSLFNNLSQRGVDIQHRELPKVSAYGDLDGIRHESFVAQGDGSLQLLRPLNQSEAAEQAAAWIRSLPVDESCVIIWPDPGLDAALWRHAQPTLGTNSPLQSNSLLCMLPLVIELAWEPIDPQVLFELVWLPLSPIPQPLGRKLLLAQQNFQPVDPLSLRFEESSHQESSNRIQTLFSFGQSRASRYSSKAILNRIHLLETWAHGQSPLHPKLFSDFDGLARQCAVLRAMITASGLLDFSALELNTLLREATQAVTPKSVFPAQAGRTRLESPGAVVDQVDHVLFWDFSQDRYVEPFRLPLSPSERQELQSFGVELPHASLWSLQQTERWRRPFLLTKGSVLCVCPQRRSDGQEAFVHPAWDEIRSKVNDNFVHLLERDQILLQRPLAHTPRAHTPLVKPTSCIQQPQGSLPLRKTESPSSIGRLLQCPLSYGLHYLFNIRPGLSWTPPSPTEPLALGSLSHHLLALVFESVKSGSNSSAAQASTFLDRLFEQQLPFMAPSLMLPGNQDVRSSLQKRLQSAIIFVFKLMEDQQLQIKGVEHSVEDPLLGILLNGKIDLLLGDPLLILDFKWSNASSREKELQAGTAYQLAIYRQLLSKAKSSFLPRIAYYIIKGGQFFSVGLKEVSGTSEQTKTHPDQIWQALEQSFVAVKHQLNTGNILAGGIGENRVPQDKIEKGRLWLSSKCEYCPYGALCGYWFGGA